MCQSPTILSSPSLVVRINDINNGVHYYDWASACAIVITSLAFRKPLSLVSFCFVLFSLVRCTVLSCLVLSSDKEN